MTNTKNPPFGLLWLDSFEQRQAAGRSETTFSSGESDPKGLSPHAPGAKLDAGKNRVWLMLEGFAPALSLLMEEYTSHPSRRIIDATRAMARWPWALEAIAEVTTVGAKKYTPGGWAEVENGFARYMDAYGRHGLALAKGQKYDDDGPGSTGCLHVAQQGWNLLAALTLTLTAPDVERGEAWANQVAAISTIAVELLNDLDLDLCLQATADVCCGNCGADENFTIQ